MQNCTCCHGTFWTHLVMQSSASRRSSQASPKAVKTHLSSASSIAPRSNRRAAKVSWQWSLSDSQSKGLR